ncbi:MAG TPA: hypothetical protein VE710_14440 [Candidatus Bathyarchaeia archaeon]|nr:hypothetical protein [Candidatus Bathyarchaeia archaeon]
MRMKKSHRIHHLLIMLTTFILMSVTMFPHYTVAAETEEVPVEIKLTPPKDRFGENTKIQIQAVTKAEGKLDTASFELEYESEEEEDVVVKAIQPDTKKIGKNYVSTAAFTPEDDLGLQIGSITIRYNIIMKDDSKTWTGTTEKRIFVDNSPPVIPSVESTFSISPSKSLQVGEKIKFSVETPNKGKIVEPAFFDFFSAGSDDTQKVEKVKTIYNRLENAYITTGYFTPQKEGEYFAYFGLLMKDQKTEEITEGTAYVKFTVEPDQNLYPSLSPQTATIKLGDEIYLLLTYKSSDASPEQFTREYNYDVTEINQSYDEKNGLHKVLIMFKPDKKKAYRFQAIVKNLVTNMSAVAKTSITVK